ncbi:MAG: hypothetical protein D6776_11685 [Planctomycetota bacterium]|nr:MAG: hypothetical protein D6776_11685 [Planctomycetota bacterium]
MSCEQEDDYGRFCEVLEDLGRGFDSEGRVIRRFGTDRLEISVTGDSVFFERKLGVICPGLAFTLSELPVLLSAFERWEELREGWGSFTQEGRYGVPGMSFGLRAWRYAPPYEPERRVGLALRRSNGEYEVKEGRIFTVERESRPVEPPEIVAPGLELTHRLWGTAPGVSPPEGHQTGETLRLARRCTVTTTRDEFFVESGDDEIAFEPHDVEVIQVLLKVLSQDQATPR